MLVSENVCYHVMRLNSKLEVTFQFHPLAVVYDGVTCFHCIINALGSMIYLFIWL
jgi:hypothetical protein